jgi:27-O-demethylrifamycin SV methyltransferase
VTQQETAPATADASAFGTDGSTSHQPAEHYDHVHDAWRLIMGEEFHYGYFESPEDSLEQATAALTEQMRGLAGIVAGDRVLDVGCGTGRHACDLSASPGAAVLGISTSRAGVSAATELARQRRVDGARFEQRDGTDNQLAGAQFHVVWALESSHLMRDRTALLRECARVLVPGGRLVLCDIIRKRDIPFQEVRSRRREFATLRAAFGDAHMEPLGHYTAMIRDLGMTVTDCSDISTQTMPTLSAWRANLRAHLPQLLRTLGHRGVDDFEQATHILEEMWHDETLGYGILAAVKDR